MSEESKNLVLELGTAKEAVMEKSATLPIGVHDVVIIDVAWKQLENEKHTEYIAITIANTAKTLMNEEKFFLTDKSIDHTRGAIRHLVHAAVGAEAASKAYSIPDLKKLLVGKVFRANITGEEFESSDGNIYVKTQLTYNGFAESLSIPIEESGLKVRKLKKLKPSGMRQSVTDTGTLTSEINSLDFS